MCVCVCVHVCVCMRVCGARKGGKYTYMVSFSHSGGCGLKTTVFIVQVLDSVECHAVLLGIIRRSS